MVLTLYYAFAFFLRVKMLLSFCIFYDPSCQPLSVIKREYRVSRKHVQLCFPWYINFYGSNNKHFAYIYCGRENMCWWWLCPYLLDTLYVTDNKSWGKYDEIYTGHEAGIINQECRIEKINAVECRAPSPYSLMADTVATKIGIIFPLFSFLSLNFSHKTIYLYNLLQQTNKNKI